MTSTAPVETGATAPDAGANHTARAERLGLGMLTVYGAGALVENMTAFGLNTLLLFYLTIVCGMSGAAAGIALGLALVVDAVADPLVGSLSDNSRSRHGRRHPFMIASAIPIAVAYGLLFSIPAGLSGLMLLAYAFVILLSVRVSLSVFGLPYVALGAEMSDDYAERSKIVAVQVLFSVIAGVAAAFLAYGVFLKGPGGQLHRDAYAPLAWSSGAIVVLGAALCGFGTLGVRHRLHAASPGKGAALGRFVGELVEVFRNRSFRTLFFTCLIFFAASGAASALGLHANTYFWKLATPSIFLISLTGTFGVFIGIFVAALLSRVMEKRNMAIVGLTVIGLCQFFPVILRLTGVLPASAAMPILMTAAFLAGIGASAAVIGFRSMMADAADEHEHLFGARREGLYFAGISFSVKASSGAGAFIAGVGLDVIGFPHGIAGSAAPLGSIPAETIRNLGLIYGPAAAVATTIAIVVLVGYKLGKHEHAKVRDALAQRRVEVAAQR